MVELGAPGQGDRLLLESYQGDLPGGPPPPKSFNAAGRSPTWKGDPLLIQRGIAPFLARKPLAAPEPNKTGDRAKLIVL